MTSDLSLSPLDGTESGDIRTSVHTDAVTFPATKNNSKTFSRHACSLLKKKKGQNALTHFCGIKRGHVQNKEKAISLKLKWSETRKK